MRFLNILQALYNEPWLIIPSVHQRICSMVEARIDGFLSDPPKREAEDICGESVEIPQMQILENGIAVIPVNGVIAQGLTKYQRGRGMVDSNDIQNEIRHAASDPKVKGILLDVDSPGGTVQGTPETASLFASVEKPTIAYASGTMASAAYWLGSKAKEVYASLSATVGSIGVYLALLDQSKALEMDGLSVEVIKSGKYKGAGLPFKPLSETDREYLQERVNDIAAMFKSEVNQKRPIHNDDMQGQAFIGSKLLSKGFIDGFCTKEQAIQRLLNLTQGNK